MLDDDRLHRVVRLISEYVRSPSLRHIRDPHSVQTLARAVLKEFADVDPVWTKWTKARDAIARPAACCWVPMEDLRQHLNGIPGPNLTRTDVTERLKAFNEETYEPWPDETQQAACLDIYRRERAEGTDMPAIVSALRQYVEEDSERRRVEQQERYRRSVEAQRQAAEQRLVSGADCKWTALGSSKTVHCRVNGRTYRLEPQADKRLQLLRVQSLDDDKGEYIGTYTRRGDATKVVSEMAFKPEPRWH